MTEPRKHCPFSKRACRDCPGFRARHYFYCHPGADRDALLRPWGEMGGAPGEEGECVWHQDLFEGIEPRFPAAADVNGSCAIDISDMVYLVDYFFAGGRAPWPSCVPVR